MADLDLTSFKQLFDEYLTYHSLEIYPSSMYDEDFCLKLPIVTDLPPPLVELPSTIQPATINPDLIDLLSNTPHNTVDDVDNVADDNADVDISTYDCTITERASWSHDYIDRKLLSDNDNVILSKIIQYIKYEWLYDEQELLNNYQNQTQIVQELSKLEYKHRLKRWWHKLFYHDIETVPVNDHTKELYPLPLYHYTNWPTIDCDMIRLSEKFSTWIFVIYGQNELFIDRVWLKIFRGGELIHHSSRVHIEVKIKLPNRTYRQINSTGMDYSIYDMKSYLGDVNKGLADVAHIVTDLAVMLGQSVANVGSLAAEAAIIAKILSVGLQIVDEMHQNVIRYTSNKGKCKFLYERCSNIITSLQSVPAHMLNLKYIVLVISKLQEAHAIIQNYAEQWRLTRFLGSKKNKRNFDNINGDLDSCYLDLGVILAVEDKVRRYQH